MGTYWKQTMNALTELHCFLVEASTHEEIGVASALFEFNEFCTGRPQLLAKAVQDGVTTNGVEDEDTFADSADHVFVFIAVAGELAVISRA